MAHDRRKPYKSPSPRKRRGRRQPGHGENKRWLNSEIHLAVDANGMPVRIHITLGTTADCTQACRLVEWIDADCIIADKGYDSDAIVRTAAERGMTVVIPPRSNRKSQREYDKYLYRARHLVESAFLKLKRWRGIATRYAKYTSSFLAAVQIRCIAIRVETLA